MILMRDDFEDVPLNSPDAARTKSHARPPRGERSEGGSADPLLAAQLQRLKAQMLQSANAHEDEQERLEQEHQHKVAELEGQQEQTPLAEGVAGDASASRERASEDGQQDAWQLLQDERAAHEEAKEHLEMLQEALRHVREEADQAAASLAERDAFWKSELEQERRTLAAAQEQLAQQASEHAAAVKAAASSAGGQHAELEQALADQRAACRGAQAEAERLAERVERLESSAAAAASQARERDAAELAEQEHALQHLRQEALLQAHEHATQARVAASQQSSDLAEQLQEAKDLLLNEQTTCRALRQDLEEQMAAVEAAQAAAARASAGEEETERALEAQLRQARAECSRLQAEVDRLRSAEQTASAAASSSQLTAAAWAAQSQEVQDLRAQLAAAGEARAAAEQERDKAKQQLTRLKAALVGEQDAEEDKVRWRVDAEVRLVREELAAGAAQQEAVARSQLAEAQAQLAAAHERLQQTQTDLEAWEAAVAARDTELQNLQTALGELTYESEAAERLRSELRASHVECDQLRSDLAQARASVKAEADARSRAEADARQAVRGGQQQHEWEQRLQEEAAMLRRALGESMKRVNMLNSDTNSMVDRRIVVKLLVTFFERGQSPEVLQLMTRMLGFTEEDKRRMGIGVERKGVLRSVATMPFNLVKGGVALARGAVVSSPRAAGSAQDDASGLADQWIDFLIQQAAAAESAEEMAKQNGKPGAEQWSRQAR
ncbi:hypothetical protein WJX72_005331 [[Myrmecia] bisecta]|uniref:GRIP domain-containing protein n=1 Tax=[Myrmecia] bisecta TaxID=41462 RepID=A0AAW1P1Z4_9CHLO